jgi:hypothetical protein
MASNGSNQVASSSNGHSNGNGIKKSIKVAGASGGFTDRQRSIADLAKCNVDFIVGDWMSECGLFSMKL